MAVSLGPAARHPSPVAGRSAARPNAATAMGMLLLAACLAGAPAAAQVDCSDPDNLCTGDPCIIPRVQVVSPCNVDFGLRTLVIIGQITVPDGGTLSLSANRIMMIHGSIRSRSTTSGASVSLTAGQDAALAGRIRLVGGEGNSVHAFAATDLTIGRPGILVSGYRGSVELTASNVLHVASGIVVQGGTDSLFAPTIKLTAGGNLSINARLGATYPRLGTGGMISAEAGGFLFNELRIRAKNGRVVLRGATGVDVGNFLDVRGQGSTGAGIVVESSGGDVAVDEPLLADGFGDGGGGDGHGGDVTIDAAGTVMVSAAISATGRTSGGAIDVSSTGGDVTLAASLSTTARLGPGGTVDVNAAGTATLSSDINAGFPGAVHVDGATVQVDSGAALTAPAGSVRLTANAGDLTLSGQFITQRAGGPPDSGTIEGMASGNLLANGVFQAGPSGCIALAAGGTLDTTGGTFDRPIVPDCPGS